MLDCWLRSASSLEQKQPLTSNITQTHRMQSIKKDANVVILGHPETRLWFQLLSLHGNLFSALNNEQMTEAGLSVAKFEVLLNLTAIGKVSLLASSHIISRCRAATYPDWYSGLFQTA